MLHLQLIILGILIALVCMVFVIGYAFCSVLFMHQGGSWPEFSSILTMSLFLILICDALFIFKFGWSKKWYPFLAGQLLCVVLWRWGFLILNVIAMGIFR